MSNLAIVKPVVNQTFDVSSGQLVDFLKLCKPVTDHISGIIFGVRDGYLWAHSSGRSASLAIKLGPFGYSDQFPVMVPFKLLSALLKTTNRNLIQISWTETHFTIGQAVCSCTSDIGLPFIAMPETNPIPSQAIREALPAMLKILDTDGPRNYANCALFYASDSAFGFVATDGFRLARSEFKATCHLPALDQICIPTTAMEILYSASKLNEEIRLGINTERDSLYVKVGDRIRAAFRLAHLKYPAYQAVIPKPVHGQLFNVKSLLAAVKQALQTTDRSKAIAISADESGNMVLKSKIDPTGPASTYLTRLCWDFSIYGKTLAINGGFLADALSTTKELNGQLCIGEDMENPVKLILGPVEIILVPIKMN